MKEEIKCQAYVPVHMGAIKDFIPCKCKAKYKVTSPRGEVSYLCGIHKRQMDKDYLGNFKIELLK